MKPLYRALFMLLIVEYNFKSIYQEEKVKVQEPRSEFLFYIST